MSYQEHHDNGVVPPLKNADSRSTSGAFSDFHSTNENLTEITDLAERRRIQNRIAQRNYRKKLRRRLEDLESRSGSRNNLNNLSNVSNHDPKSFTANDGSFEEGTESNPVIYDDDTKEQLFGHSENISNISELKSTTSSLPNSSTVPLHEDQSPPSDPLSEGCLVNGRWQEPLPNFESFLLMAGAYGTDKSDKLAFTEGYKEKQLHFMREPIMSSAKSSEKSKNDSGGTGAAVFPIEELDIKSQQQRKEGYLAFTDEFEDDLELFAPETRRKQQEEIAMWNSLQSPSEVQQHRLRKINELKDGITKLQAARTHLRTITLPVDQHHRLQDTEGNIVQQIGDWKALSDQSSIGGKMKPRDRRRSPSPSDVALFTPRVPQCLKCKAIFKRSADLVRHMLFKHPSDKREPRTTQGLDLNEEFSLVSATSRKRSAAGNEKLGVGQLALPKGLHENIIQLGEQSQEISHFNLRQFKHRQEQPKTQETYEAEEAQKSSEMRTPAPANISKDVNEGTRSRRNSGTWSIVSFAETIFSTQSVMSGSPVSSLNTSHDMTELFVRLLLDNNPLKSVCLNALAAIPRGQFEPKLRTVLMTFATDLRQEASTGNQQNTARFVKYRARELAHLICNRLNHPFKKKGPIELKDEDDKISDESDPDRSEGNIDSIHQLQTFIKTSMALKYLQNSLEEFVKRFVDADTQNRPEQKKGKATETLSQIALPCNDELEETVVTSVEEPTQPLTKPQMRSWMQMPTLHVSQFAERVGQFLKLIGLLRPSLAHGKTRIEWQCRCGHKMYDDFIEIKSGAAERYRLAADHSSNQTQSTGLGKETRLGQLLFRIVQGFGATSSKNTKQGSGATLPLHSLSSSNGGITASATAGSIAPPTAADMLYLLLCYSDGRYATRLLQLDLFAQKAASDKALFRVLRSHYTEIRGRWLSFFSFRVLCSIKFVQFELYKSELVDVRKENDIPPPENVDYRYQPAPPELIPPVSERHLMHLFEHPDHAEDEPICLDRFPKKMIGKLKCHRGISPGWGLQFVEGWDMRKIWAVVFSIFGIGSLLIGILLMVFEHSIQDAFTMAGYVVAMAAVSVGTLQAFLGG